MWLLRSRREHSKALWAAGREDRNLKSKYGGCDEQLRALGQPEK